MYRFVKRLMDIVVSALACLLLLPVFILLALCIRFESPGSPIFTQLRVGRNCRPFTIFKFRSMVKDAPSRGEIFTVANDPRITRFGRFMRGTSLDELPQLWNVLLGDMSLIGPRPELEAHASHYQPAEWELRHRVRPGITGLAQVNGRSATTPEARLHHDLTYAAAPTLVMDMRVAMKTAAVVLRKTGTN